MGEQGVHPLGCPGRPTRPCTRPVHVPGGPLAKARVPGSPNGLLVAAPAPACCSTIPAKAGIAAREDVFWGTSNLLTARNDDIATLWGGASAETGTAKSWQRSGGAQVAVGGREMTVAKSKKVAATSFCGRGSSKRSVLTCYGHGNSALIRVSKTTYRFGHRHDNVADHNVCKQLVRTSMNTNSDDSSGMDQCRSIQCKAVRWLRRSLWPHT